MGIALSLKPARLAEKLVQIRVALGLSQNEMISRLGLSDEVIREELSAFERGLRQPPLVALLKYARCVGISTDVLIDDELNLPDKLLKGTSREVISRTRTPRTNRKR
ncbi:MAG TPA: helix-turn-helix transcriptional regulator [Pyrinomonadaceae bacterium]|jgi:transcriptional regulator with XRE-family HTH domain|nr:helix-turn-helix transcriptional regulator [Pyrinomonadaceae bacterium]